MAWPREPRIKNMRWAFVLLAIPSTAVAERAVVHAQLNPLGLPSIPAAGGSHSERAAINLGRQLFFDRRLSADNSLSCASCHDPQKGWSNGERFATGIGGQIVRRNVPTVVNSVYLTQYFWDGRSSTLEDVVPQPIEHPREMGLPMNEAANRLNKIEGYRQQFQSVFHSDATADNIAEAIAAFLRTLRAGNSPSDRYPRRRSRIAIPSRQARSRRVRLSHKLRNVSSRSVAFRR